MRLLIAGALCNSRDAKLFLSACLPFLLSSGNLPKLAGSHETTVKIYAPESARNLITSHPLFKQAALIAQFELQAFGATSNDVSSAVASDIISKVRKLAFEEALETGSILINIEPGLIISEGALPKLMELAATGKSSVFASAPLISNDKFTRHSRYAFGEFRLRQNMDSRELVKLALNCLSAKTERMFINSNFYYISNPGAIYWPTGDTGFLARDANLYPLMIYPHLFRQEKSEHSMDILCSPATLGPAGYVVTDSDELVLFLIESDETPEKNIKEGKFSLLRFAEHVKTRMHMGQRKNLSRAIMIHFEDLPGHWRQVVKESSRVIGKMFFTVSILDNLLWAKGKTEVGGKKRIVIFGCGNGGLGIIDLAGHCGIDVAAVVDNNKRNWGGSMEGIPVKSPEELPDIDFDLIVVASIPGKKEIFRQLSGMGYRYALDYIYFLDEMYVGNLMFRLRTPLKIYDSKYL